MERQQGLTGGTKKTAADKQGKGSARGGQTGTTGNELRKEERRDGKGQNHEGRNTGVGRRWDRVEAAAGDRKEEGTGEGVPKEPSAERRRD